MGALHRALWTAGLPGRVLLIGLIRVYRLLLSPVMGGGCRFHPTCSVYAEEAIRNTGAMRGTALAVWRVLRCSPLTKGGVDWPPGSKPTDYENDTRAEDARYESIIQPVAGANR